MTRMTHRLTASMILRGALCALFLLASVAAATAETLMMPKRDGLVGTPVVVWGVSTLANGSAYTVYFGDGASVAGFVSDRSYIAFEHTYAAQGNYTATLVVGAESASVPLQIFDSASLTPENLRGVKINMAIQNGLRYLWWAQAGRAANFPAAVTTNWGGAWYRQWAALITLAFENHGYRLPSDGSAPTGIYEKYVVRRGLNYIISNLAQISLPTQNSVVAGQPVRDACAGAGIEAAPCIGLYVNSDPGYTSGVIMLPFAASGALSRINTEVAGYTNGKTYGEILQRMSNALAWGQNDSGTGRGGWYYNYNSTSMDGSTAGWALLGMLDAEAAGTTIPAWVKTEFPFGLNNSLNNDGSLDYQGNGNAASDSYPNLEKAGVGLQGLFFIGETSGARVEAVKNYISARWNSGRLGPDYTGWGCNAIPNRGCAYAMFNNFKGLKLHGVTTLPGVGRAAGPGSIPANDWYASYQDWLVNNQTSPNVAGGGGYWSGMRFSGIANDTWVNAAMAELILSPVALVLPDEDKFRTVGLTPATSTGAYAGTHTVTAKAEATSGAPVAGATVTFTILSGPNAGQNGTGTTDATGQTTFTYTSTGVGEDRIQAAIGTLASNIVNMIWTPVIVTAQITAGDKVYDGTPGATITGCTLTGVLPADVSGVTCSYSSATGTFSSANVGTSDVTATGLTLTGAAAGNYLIGSTVGTTASITPAPTTTVVTCPASVVYTGTAQVACTATVTGAGGLSTSVAVTYAGNTDVGTATASATYAGDANHDGSTGTASFAITPAALTVTANDQTRSHTAANPALDGTVTGAVPSDGLSATYSSYTGNAPGTYDIVPALVDPNGRLGNYVVTIVNGTLTVTNAAPVATANAYATTEDAAVSGNVITDAPADSDGDNDPLTASVVAGPAHGTLTLDASGAFTYTPGPNYNGSDTFSYRVNDGLVDGTVATVTLTVAAVNDAPVAAAGALETAEDTAASGTLQASDVDGDALSFALASGASHGAVVVNADGSYSYTPAPNYNGADAFTFTVSDGHGGTDTATVSITVTAVNDVPTFAAPGDISVSATGPNGAAVTFSASGEDVEDGTMAAVCVPPSGSTFPIGTTPVACTITDSGGAVVSASFTVTVTNNAPTISVPGDMSVSATGPTGAVVGFAASGTDVEDGAIAAVCVPASGSTFPIGTTPVSCTVTDVAGATATASFTVTVTNNAPTFTPPANITVAATGATGAAVTFTATGEDVEDGPITAVCTPASGVTFPIGTTPVACTVTDTAGVSVSGSFTVTVTNNAPTISVPADMTVEGNAIGGATAGFAATASDIEDGSLTPTCSAVSGALFPVGTTTVTCAVTDSGALSASATFTITVVDTTPPALTLPAAITVHATSPTGAVEWTATAVDIVDGAVAVTCTPPSGSVFGVNTPTPVSCTAIDAHGNAATGSFVVTRVDAAPVCTAAVASPGLLWPPNHRLVPISLQGVTDADVDALILRVTSIWQDEPTNTEGDGRTAIDADGIGTAAPRVRAERSGRGNGRVYHIAFTATDAAGLSCTGSVTVGVPHDREHAIVDGGARFDSTVPFPLRWEDRDHDKENCSDDRHDHSRDDDRKGGKDDGKKDDDGKDDSKKGDGKKDDGKKGRS